MKMRMTKDVRGWLAWFKDFGARAFLKAFLHNVEGAESRCQYCHEPIYVDVLIGGGVPDWSTADGDFGCDRSPERDGDCCGGHMPVKKGGKK